MFKYTKFFDLKVMKIFPNWSKFFTPQMLRTNVYGVPVKGASQVKTKFLEPVLLGTICAVSFLIVC